MRRAAVVLALSLAPLVAFAAQLRGAWHAKVDGDRVQLDLLRDGSRHGRSFPRTELQLSDAQINAATETPVSFSLVRDAGSIAMTGSFQAGEGVGRFTFTPNASYGQTVRALGVEIDEELTDEHLFSLAMIDVSTAFIREMVSLGYRESLSQYTAFRIHGVTAAFVRELATLGYSKLTAEQLVTFRIHGVSTDFVRAMKDLGYTASADELVTFRIHGVTPDFVRAMRELGVKDLDTDQLVAMRIHGVTSDYVRDLRGLGYSGLSSDQLVTMRIHGVSTRFIRELKSAGYQNVPVEKLIEMRIHGIDAHFLTKAK
jgi:hypothetical protein